MRLAVLIDADNVPHDRVSGMMKEIARYGTPTIKRIYGDWTKPDLRGWKNLLLTNAITPIQQYRYTVGKNATDSAMIIEAMDMLYAGNVDGFFIVSSDSDFTRLALRLRESGKKVFGMGERKTPKPFIVACDKFIYIEIIDVTVEKPDLDMPSGRQPAPRSGRSDAHSSQRAQPVHKQDSGKPPAAAPAAAPTPAAIAPDTKTQDTKPVEQATEKSTDKTVDAAHKEPARGRSRRRKPSVSRVESKPEVAAPVPATTVPVEPEPAAPVAVEPPPAAEHHTEHHKEATPAGAPGGSNLVEAVSQEIIDLIATSINDLADENGWAFLGDVGTLIAKKQPDFDPRNYGFMKLTPLVRSLDAFELDIRETNQFHIKHVYIRNREGK